MGKLQANTFQGWSPPLRNAWIDDIQPVAVGMAVTCHPAQIRTCGTIAYGSCRGYVTRSDPQGKDVHFSVLVCRGRQGVRSVTIEADYAGCDVRRFSRYLSLHRLTMRLFSRPAVPDPGSAVPCLSAPSFVSVQTSVPGISLGLARTAHVSEPGSDDPDHGAVRPVSRSGLS
jgi:hypothetical protein